MICRKIVRQALWKWNRNIWHWFCHWPKEWGQHLIGNLWCICSAGTTYKNNHQCWTAVVTWLAFLALDPGSGFASYFLAIFWKIFTPFLERQIMHQFPHRPWWNMLHALLAKSSLRLALRSPYFIKAISWIPLYLQDPPILSPIIMVHHQHVPTFIGTLAALVSNVTGCPCSSLSRVYFKQWNVLSDLTMLQINLESFCPPSLNQKVYGHATGEGCHTILVPECGFDSLVM